MPILADARHALRLLGRSPVFTLTAVLSLALGIAASSTIFSLADALMFAPRAGVQDASRVVDIGRTTRGGGFDNMTHPAFRYLREHATTLAGMAAVDFSARPMSLTVDESSERVFGSLVSANYFEVLGTRPALGRFFAAEEDRVPGQHPVVVLTHRPLDDAVRRRSRHPSRSNPAQQPGIHRRRRGRARVRRHGAGQHRHVDPDGDGRDRARHAATSDLLEEPRAVWHVAIGRLAPGASRAGDAELNTLMAAYKASEPRANQDHGVAIAPLSRIPGPAAHAVSRLHRHPLRADRRAARHRLRQRRRDAARARDGAAPGDRDAAGRRREPRAHHHAAAHRDRRAVLRRRARRAAADVWLMALLVGLLPSLPVPISLELGVNPRVAVFAIGVSLAASLLFGLAPARQALRGNVVSNLYGAHGTADRRRFRLRNTLVVAQVALSLMLVVTAFMFVRTLQNAGPRTRASRRATSLS
jgi:putative ABC transport system permease protein